MGDLRRSDESDVADLVRAAARGDNAAWDVLVDRYVGLLWSIALRHGIGEADAADVVQSTWMRLLEHVEEIRDPSRVAAWLATTARREALRVVELRRRVALRPDADMFDGPDVLSTPVDEHLLSSELRRDARLAVETLPDSWRQLMELLVSDPPMSYEEISQRLDMPIGSIGPTRGRCIVRMRSILGST